MSSLTLIEKRNKENGGLSVADFERMLALRVNQEQHPDAVFLMKERLKAETAIALADCQYIDTLNDAWTQDLVSTKKRLSQGLQTFKSYETLIANIGISNIDSFTVADLNNSKVLSTIIDPADNKQQELSQVENAVCKRSTDYYDVKSISVNTGKTSNSSVYVREEITSNNYRNSVSNTIQERKGDFYWSCCTDSGTLYADLVLTIDLGLQRYVDTIYVETNNDANISWKGATYVSIEKYSNREDSAILRKTDRVENITQLTCDGGYYRIIEIAIRIRGFENISTITDVLNSDIPVIERSRYVETFIPYEQYTKRHVEYNKFSVSLSGIRIPVKREATYHGISYENTVNKTITSVGALIDNTDIQQYITVKYLENGIQYNKTLPVFNINTSSVSQYWTTERQSGSYDIVKSLCPVLKNSFITAENLTNTQPITVEYSYNLIDWFPISVEIPEEDYIYFRIPRSQTYYTVVIEYEKTSSPYVYDGIQINTNGTVNLKDKHTLSLTHTCIDKNKERDESYTPLLIIEN
jgi:hypothetical protein